MENTVQEEIPLKDTILAFATSTWAAVEPIFWTVFDLVVAWTVPLVALYLVYKFATYIYT